MEWRTELDKIATSGGAESAEDAVSLAWRRFNRRMQFSKGRQILAYTGYGNMQRIRLRGRVLANRRPHGPGIDQHWWDNLRSIYQRRNSDAIHDARVLLSYGSQKITVRTDANGYYEAEFRRDSNLPDIDFVLAELVHEGGIITAQHRIALVDPGAEYIVISNIDEILVHTGITELLRTARLAFLNRAKIAKPLPGAAGLYRHLCKASNGSAGNAFFYISDFAMNMYDLLYDVIELNDLPQGPIFLRNVGINYAANRSGEHKLRSISELLDHTPGMPVLLVGDAGQLDVAIYERLAALYPSRIRAIYIRDTDAESYPESEQLTTGEIPLVRGAGCEEFANHMHETGLLSSESVSEIVKSVARDEARARRGLL